MILNCSCRKIKLLGAVFAALFLFLSTCAVAEDLPTDREEVPTGYIEDAEQAEGSVEQRVFFHFDADLFYTYSDASDSDALSGYSADVLAAPTFKINKGTFLSLVYDGAYRKKREFYSNDSGYSERSEFMSHTIAPVLKADFGENDRYTVKPVLFFTKTYNKDTDDSDWDDGLYNYEDIGGGVDLQIRDLLSGNNSEDEWTVGFQLYLRDYVNYTSLLDLAAGLNTETDEKDYIGLILKTDYEQTRDLGFSWNTGYSLFIKWLDDKKVVGASGANEGVLTSDEQEDFLHMLNADGWYYFENGLKFGVNLDLHYKDSNQNYYEGFGTVGTGDDAATEDYYDYWMYQVEPNVSYQFRFVPLTLFASFSYQNLEYTDRLAENASGTAYKNEEQVDETYTTLVGARYAFNENWALVCQWEHVDADSNNDDESTYNYDYWSDAFSIGLSIKF